MEDFLGLFSSVLINRLFRIGVILLAAGISQRFFKGLIKSFQRRLKTVPGETPSHRARRVKTLTSLLSNSVNLAIVLIAALMILAEIGVNLTPFLTGAGIFGLALGMGMKDLAADMVGGFFLLLDNQINVGDRIKVNNIEGRVVKVGLRYLTLKDKENSYYIPNSSIKIIAKLRKRG